VLRFLCCSLDGHVHKLSSAPNKKAECSGTNPTHRVGLLIRDGDLFSFFDGQGTTKSLRMGRKLRPAYKG